MQCVWGSQCSMWGHTDSFPQYKETKDMAIVFTTSPIMPLSCALKCILLRYTHKSLSSLFIIPVYHSCLSFLFIIPVYLSCLSFLFIIFLFPSIFQIHHSPYLENFLKVLPFPLLIRRLLVPLVYELSGFSWMCSHP